MHRHASPEPDEILSENLRLLEATGRPFHAPAGSGRIRMSRAGDVAVAEVLVEPQGWVRLHSARNPSAEAAAVVDAALEGRPDTGFVAVIGAGLGWVLDEFERRGATPCVIVFDPTPELSLLWLSRRRWETWLAAGRLALVTGPDYLGTSRLWSMVEAGSRPAILANPAIVRAFPDEAKRAREALERLLYGAAENANARRRFGPRHLAATLENLPRVLVEGNAGSLGALAAGRPAIVVGAGPSLNDNVEALVRARDRATIIAADTALRPLLAHGVRPHLVVSVDPSDENATHLQDLPECPDVWLVAEAGVSPAALAQFEGRTFFFRVSDSPPWPWLRQRGVDTGTLRVWGSVVTAALDLALTMGARTVLFSGLDLAYSRGQPYCRHSTFESRWARWAALGDGLANQWAFCRDPEKPRAPDIGGGEVVTTRTLLEFRDWLVEQSLVRRDVRFVNATGRGILHGGLVHEGHLDAELAQSTVVPDWDLSERWAAARHDDAVRQGVAVGLESVSTGPIPPAWAEFTDTDAGALAKEVAGRAAARLRGDHPRRSSTYVRVAPPPVATFPLPLADAMEVLRSLLSRREVQSESSASPDFDEARRCLEAARVELLAIFHRSGPEADPPPEVEIIDGRPERVPAAFAFVWPGPLVGAVRSVETHLARACRAVGSTGEAGRFPSSATEAGPGGALVPTAIGNLGPGRLALAADFASVAAFVTTRARPGSDAAHWWQATAEILRLPSHDGAERDRLAWRVVDPAGDACGDAT